MSIHLRAGHPDPDKPQRNHDTKKNKSSYHFKNLKISPLIKGRQHNCGGIAGYRGAVQKTACRNTADICAGSCYISDTPSKQAGKIGWRQRVKRLDFTAA
jgi:hypothetical protein